MGVGEWWSDAKTVLQVALRFGNVDPYNVIADLEEENRRLRREVADREDTIAELRERLETEEELEYNDGIYVERTGDGFLSFYCSRCWDRDGERIRLHEPGNGYFVCPECNTAVEHGFAD